MSWLWLYSLLDSLFLLFSEGDEAPCPCSGWKFASPSPTLPHEWCLSLVASTAETSVFAAPESFSHTLGARTVISFPLQEETFASVISVFEEVVSTASQASNTSVLSVQGLARPPPTCQCRCEFPHDYRLKKISTPEPCACPSLVPGGSGAPRPRSDITVVDLRVALVISRPLRGSIFRWE